MLIVCRRSPAPLSTSQHDCMRKITELINIFHLDSPQVALACCNVNKKPITGRITRTRQIAPQKVIRELHQVSVFDCKDEFFLLILHGHDEDSASHSLPGQR